MAIYVSVGKIKGDTTAEGHELWLTCDSLSWGVGRGISTPTGAASKREASAPSLSEVTLSKSMDKATPLLFLEACVGVSQPVKIDLTKTGGDKLETFMTYELTNAIVSGYSVSAGSDGTPVESISFNFTKIEMKYTPYDDKHKAGSPIPAAYDIKTAKKG